MKKKLNKYNKCISYCFYLKNIIKKNMILYMDITDNGLMMKYIFSAFRIVTDMN